MSCIQNMQEALSNVFSGVRYANVILQRQKYKSLDLGVKVIRFEGGRCRAAILEFDGSVSESTKSLSRCFLVPFTPGVFTQNDTRYLQHPMGWIWVLGKKRLTLDKAVQDWREKSMQERMVGGNKYNTKKYLYENT